MSRGVPTQKRVDELVAEALEHGSLYGNKAASKTLTIGGRRVHRIRLQSAIFTRHYGWDLSSGDAWLAPLIDAAIARHREAQ